MSRGIFGRSTAYIAAAVALAMIDEGHKAQGPAPAGKATPASPPVVKARGKDGLSPRQRRKLAKAARRRQAQEQPSE